MALTIQFSMQIFKNRQFLQFWKSEAKKVFSIRFFDELTNVFQALNFFWYNPELCWIPSKNPKSNINPWSNFGHLKKGSVEIKSKWKHEKPPKMQLNEKKRRRNCMSYWRERIVNVIQLRYFTFINAIKYFGVYLSVFISFAYAFIVSNSIKMRIKLKLLFVALKMCVTIYKKREIFIIYLTFKVQSI